MSVEFRSIQNPNNDKCAICLDEEMQDNLVSHKINDNVQHIFHEECLTPWLKNHLTCPLCRLNVSSVNAQPVMTHEMVIRRWSHLTQVIFEGSDLALQFPLGDETLVVGLRSATRAGDLERVQELLTDGHLTQEERELALHFAIHTRQFDIACKILETGPISDGRRADLLLVAHGKRCSFDVFCTIFESGAGAFESSGRILYTAAKRGALDIAQVLLENVPVSQSDRAVAAMQAADRGHFDMARMLLANNAVSEEVLAQELKAVGLNPVFENDRVLIDSLKLKPLNRVQVLIENGSISRSHLLMAITFATIKGNVMIASLLTKHLLARSWGTCSVALVGAIGMYNYMNG